MNKKYVFIMNAFAPHACYWTRSLQEYDSKEEATEEFERIAVSLFGDWKTQDGAYFQSRARVGDYAFGRITESTDTWINVL